MILRKMSLYLGGYTRTHAYQKHIDQKPFLPYASDSKIHNDIMIGKEVRAIIIVDTSLHSLRIPMILKQ